MMQPPPTHHPIRDPLLWLAMLVVGAMLTLLSLARYWGYNSGMLDLGNMSQAILSVLRGEPLVWTGPYGNGSRLAGHVEIFYLAFVPLVAIWPNPQVLLIGQALLATVGAIPAYRIALRQLDSRMAARCIALIYLFYPVMQTAVLFDFHGDTLAMPLLLFALDAADRKAWRSYGLWLALALSCKVYVAAPVAGIGAYLWLWGGDRRVGFWTMVAAVVYGGVVFFGVREFFADSQVVGAAATSYVNHYYGDLGAIAATLPDRFYHALLVFGPMLLLGWRGWRWLLPAAPLTLAVLVSTGPGAVYQYNYHHYALVVPFVVLAVVDGALRARAQVGQGAQAWRWQVDLGATTVLVVLASALLVQQPLNPRFWSREANGGLHHWIYGRIERDVVKDRVLAEHVPEHAPLAASIFLAPHLANRDTLYVVRYPQDLDGSLLPTILPHVDYVLADALFDWRAPTTHEQVQIRMALDAPDFGLVVARDGLLLFERDAPTEAVLPQTVTLVSMSDLPDLELALGPALLRGVEVLPIEGRRFQARFVWQLNGPPPAHDWVAI
ncbi:DUF2079 domain-containing protein, partial [Candidatus Viridilinea mediisalina]